MSWRNERKVSSIPTGVIAGQKVTSKAVGRYTNYQLLKRVTASNILFESNYYQESDTTMNQMEDLVKKVEPEDVLELAVEIRKDQGLRHTPLWLIVLVVQHYKGFPVRSAIEKICTRPDMMMDLLAMWKFKLGKTKLRGIPKSFKKAFASILERTNEFQLARYQKKQNEISLVDVVNLCHPKSTPALDKLMKGELKSMALENRLSAGEKMKDVFTDQIENNTLGSFAILRNIQNFIKAGLDRKTIIKAIEQVNSKWLAPFDFYKAYKYGETYLPQIGESMAKSFSNYKIKGTTILAVDVSGSMGGIISSNSEFKRYDYALALTALASSIFEDLILVFTAGNDGGRQGSHVRWTANKGLNICEDFNRIRSIVGGGGIFTYQLCEWLKTEKLAQQAERLVVISDSQDIDVASGSKNLPDTSPYKYSYIIDISTHTHGIKTNNWTAEINGTSDKLFHYIAELEKILTGNK